MLFPLLQVKDLFFDGIAADHFVGEYLFSLANAVGAAYALVSVVRDTVRCCYILAAFRKLMLGNANTNA